MNTLREYAGFATKEFVGMERATTKTNKGFNVLRGTAASLAGNIGSNLVFGLQDAIVNTISLGTEMQRAETRFVAFADSIQQGQMQYQQYFELAQRLGVAFEPLVDIGTQFRAVGFEADEAADLIERLTIAAGGSSEAVDSIGRSLRQMKAGRVELEELNPIAEAGVPIFHLLAEELGVTLQELRKLTSTSKVEFESVIAAFKKFTDEGSKAHRAAEETAKTLSASFQRLRNEAGLLASESVEAVEGPLSALVDWGAAFVEAARVAIQASEDIGEANRVLFEEIRAQANATSGVLAKARGGNLDEANRILEDRRSGLQEIRGKIRDNRASTSPLAPFNLAQQLQIEKILEEQVRLQENYVLLLREALGLTNETKNSEEERLEINKDLLQIETEHEGILKSIKERRESLNTEIELGFLDQEKAQRTIISLEEKNLLELTKLSAKAQEFVDNLDDPALYENWDEFIKNVGEFADEGLLQAFGDVDTPQTLEEWNSILTLINENVGETTEKYQEAKLALQEILEEKERQREAEKAALEAQRALEKAQQRIIDQATDAWMINLNNADVLTREELIYKNHIQSQERIRELEDERTMALIENDSLLNQGIITYDTYKNKIETINEDFLTGTNKVVLSIKEWADTIDDPALRARVLEFLDKMKEKQDSLTQNTSGGSLLGPSRFEGTGGANISDPISEGGGTVLEPWWTGVEEFVDGPTFGKIEEGINIAIDGFDALGQIINNGANAELDALNLKLKELQEQNRVERERIQEQYEKEIEGIQITYDLAKTNASDLRDQKIADAQEELKEGKLTAKQLADEKNKFEREHAATVKKLGEDAAKQREKAKKQRKEDLKELKNAEIDIQNEIRQKKYAADIQAFHFNQALRYSQIFIEGAIAFVRAIPNPFAMFAAAASTAAGAAIISSASPPPKPGPIPKYAEGGYVDKPTLLIAGEGGEGEYIIPESQIGHYNGMPRHNY